MKKMNTLAPLLMMTAMVVGCSQAPFSNETTARSNGKGQWSSQLGATVSQGGDAGFYARQGYGVLEDWDLGLDLETASHQIGLWTRYSLVNQPEKMSFAFIGGMGYGSEDSFEYGYAAQLRADVYNMFVGPLISYKFNAFEIFSVLRYNLLVRSGDYSSVALDDFKFVHDPSYTMSYGSLGSGFNYWLGDQLGFTADANILFDDQVVSEPYYNLGIIFKY